MTAPAAPEGLNTPDAAGNLDDAARPQRVRRVVSVALAVLAVLTAVIDVPARYVENNVLDTQGYVEMIGPLAADPAVQDAVGNAVSEAVLEQIDLDAYAQTALEGLAEGESIPDGITVLAPVIAGQAENLVRTTSDRLASSEQFTGLWITANRTGHAVLVSALEGDAPGPLTVEDGIVAVPLDPLIEHVRDALVDRGLDAAASIDPQGREIVLISSPELATTQKALTVFHGISAALPWLVLGLLVAAVWTAPRRRHRTAAWTAGSLAALTAALVAGIHLAIGTTLGNLPSGVPVDAAAAAAGAFTSPLLTQLWWAFALWAVITAASIAWPWAQSHVRGRLEHKYQPAPTA